MKPPIYLTPTAPIAELVLNKPDKRNALSVDMWAEIPGLIAEVEATSDIKVLIIHGGSSGAFAAGADISEFADTYATQESAAASGKVIADALSVVENCAKPVLAAIEGACVGGGVSLAMCADIRIAAESAKFGITPARLGIVYPAGDTRRLMASIGPSKTKDLLFTGRIFPASGAEKIGLIDRCVPDGNALGAARDLAQEICNVSQWSARATKQMIKGLQSGWADDDQQAVRLFTEGFSNADFEEGHSAFLEKQEPKFTL